MKPGSPFFGPLWPWALALLLTAGSCTVACSAFLTRKQGNESDAIAQLQEIASAQSLFREADLDQNGEFEYCGNLADLVAAGFVSEDVLRPGPYRFALATGRAPEFLWMATAVPTRSGLSGDRSFVVNQSGVIVVSAGEVRLNEACAIPVPKCVGDCAPQQQCWHVGIGR